MSTLMNLAGRTNATEIIKRELNRCGIQAVEDPNYDHPEVKTKTVGKLATPTGGITFHRHWHYYAAHGLVLLEIAEKLYADETGKDDIRVNGMCTSPPPKGNAIVWVLPSGMRVLPRRAEEDATRATKSTSRPLRESGKRILLNHAFSDDPASVGANPFIDCYYIDSELGLYIFVRAVTRQPW